jgi:ectoine hydroxylase-related dioxygenase (phytanoyl-CoA dioxygenase family)
MLHDFTIDNGATWLLPKSQMIRDCNDSLFKDKSIQITGKAGDILVFDSRLLHKAGQNNTTGNRDCLTLTLTKPFFKQQLDYTKGVDQETLDASSDYIKQLLGYYSRVPTCLDEYYQPSHRRFYQKNQD